MARHTKNTVDYFPHPCKHGRRMAYLESQFKNDGYAVWMKLLEELGNADFHIIDLKDQLDWLHLVGRSNISEARFKKILDALVMMDAFDKELFEAGYLCSEEFIESIADAYRNRKYSLELFTSVKRKILGSLSISDVRKPVSDVIKQQTKVKETKGKKDSDF